MRLGQSLKIHRRLIFRTVTSWETQGNIKRRPCGVAFECFAQPLQRRNAPLYCVDLEALSALVLHNLCAELIELISGTPH